MNDFYHKSVLLQEAIDFLSIKADGKYIDATLGGGGHAEEILRRKGKVLGIDLDKDALEHSEQRLKDYENLTLVSGNFRDIDEIAKTYGFVKVSGIIADLGVSSHQIDDENQGFTYQKNAPLDMRMDKNQKLQAKDLLNILTKGELNEIFTKYGQEPRSNAISNGIIGARRIKAFENTSDLTDVIDKAYDLKGEINNKMKAKFYSRVFQALRIAVNDEIGSLQELLRKSIILLEEGGRIAVISFHSLEDKVVKESFKSMEEQRLGIILTKKPIIPSYAEISQNNRSRSAKLRVFEKI